MRSDLSALLNALVKSNFTAHDPRLANRLIQKKIIFSSSRALGNFTPFTVHVLSQFVVNIAVSTSA